MLTSISRAFWFLGMPIIIGIPIPISAHTCAVSPPGTCTTDQLTLLTIKGVQGTIVYVSIGLVHTSPDAFDTMPFLQFAPNTHHG